MAVLCYFRFFGCPTAATTVAVTGRGGRPDLVLAVALLTVLAVVVLVVALPAVLPAAAAPVLSLVLCAFPRCLDLCTGFKCISSRYRISTSFPLGKRSVVVVIVVVVVVVVV